MGKKLDNNTRITSTSDVTIGDIVDAVSERISRGSSREAIEKVVKETVRPCAIGKIPSVMATGDGNTRRFSGGQLRPGRTGAHLLLHFSLFSIRINLFHWIHFPRRIDNTRRFIWGRTTY